MVTGIIGGIGSGKSLVSDFLSESYGVRVIGTDGVAKELEKPGRPVYEALVAAFGEGILEEGNGAGRPIDKSALASLMFEERERVDLVDDIVHPAVWQEVRRLLRDTTGDALVETALPGADFRDICDRVWFVWADEEKRIERLMESRDYSLEKCRSMIAAQPSDEDYMHLADLVIANNGTAEDLRLKLEEFF